MLDLRFIFSDRRNLFEKNCCETFIDKSYISRRSFWQQFLRHVVLLLFMKNIKKKIYQFIPLNFRGCIINFFLEVTSIKTLN